MNTDSSQTSPMTISETTQSIIFVIRRQGSLLAITYHLTYILQKIAKELKAFDETKTNDSTPFYSLIIYLLPPLLFFCCSLPVLLWLSLFSVIKNINKNQHKHEYFISKLFGGCRLIVTQIIHVTNVSHSLLYFWRTRRPKRNSLHVKSPLSQWKLRCYE